MDESRRVRRRLFEFITLMRHCHGLLQRRDLKCLHRIFPQGRLITRVFGGHGGTRGMSQVNVVAGAGHFLETLREFPSLGVSVGPVGCQIHIAATAGTFRKEYACSLAFGESTGSPAFALAVKVKALTTATARRMVFFIVLSFFFVRRLPLFIHIPAYAAATGIPQEKVCRTKERGQ